MGARVVPDQKWVRRNKRKVRDAVHDALMRGEIRVAPIKGGLLARVIPDVVMNEMDRGPGVGADGAWVYDKRTRRFAAVIRINRDGSRYDARGGRR